MRKQMITIFALSLSLMLSACQNTEKSDNQSASAQMSSSDSTNSVDSAVSNDSQPTDSVDVQNKAANPITVGTFDDSAFSGKILSFSYADENTVIVLADKLYLYDTQKGAVTATAAISLRDIRISSYSGGYLVTGFDEKDGDCSGILFDKNLKNETQLDFTSLTKDVPMSENVTISSDGKTIAIGGIYGLYLYDTGSKTISTILNYKENIEVNNMRLTRLSSFSFIDQGNKLAYVGGGFPIPVIDGVSDTPIYGTVSIDGSNLNIIKNTSYYGSELLAGGNTLLMPQDFKHNNGSLLIMDASTGEETVMHFSDSSEGLSGVFCSEQGQYYATAVLGNDDITIRIYDTSTGKLLHTETYTNIDNVYLNRLPEILLLDDSKTCIAIFGQSINEVDTLTRTFGFDE